MKNGKWVLSLGDWNHYTTPHHIPNNRNHWDDKYACAYFVRMCIHFSHISRSIVERTLVYVCYLAELSIHLGFRVSSYLYAMHKSTVETERLAMSIRCVVAFILAMVYLKMQWTTEFDSWPKFFLIFLVLFVVTMYVQIFCRLYCCCCYFTCCFSPLSCE